MSQKGFIHIIIIVLVLVLAIGGILYLSIYRKKLPSPTSSPSSTNNPTSEWKTYTNTKYKFSVEYPKAWSVRSENIPYGYSQERGKFEISLGSTLFGNIENEPEQVTIEVFNLNNGDHLNEFKRWLTDTETFSEINFGKNKFIRYQNVNVNNNPGSYKKLDFYTIENDNKTYGAKIMVGSWLDDYKSNEVNKDILDHILSTFKFENNTDSSDLKPADSQTPTAGICFGPSEEPIVTVTINEDTPSPRCAKVSSSQKIKLSNNTTKTVSISLGKLNTNLDPGKDYIYQQSFGSFLAPGVHSITTTPYGGPEIWLQ